MLLRRLCRRCALGLAVPLGFGLGAWPLSHVGAFSLPGAAAAASPPGRFGVGCAAWDWVGCLAFVLRRYCLLWRFQAASYLSVFNAFACRLALVTSGGVRCCFGLPPFVNNRPLSEGAAGVSRLGGEGWHTYHPFRLCSHYMQKSPVCLYTRGTCCFYFSRAFRAEMTLFCAGMRSRLGYSASK